MEIERPTPSTTKAPSEQPAEPRNSHIPSNPHSLHIYIRTHALSPFRSSLCLALPLSPPLE
jgi:hypothetical protein